MKKITETKTEEYFLFTRSQTKLIYDLFNKLGVWKMLELLNQERKSPDEKFLDNFWHELEEVLVDEN